MTHTLHTEARVRPLPFALVRSISLENHMSLAAMRSGHGTPDTMCVLLRILYTLFYMLEGNDCGTDLPLFLEVEAALDTSIHAAASGREWQLAEHSIPVIEAMLVRFDEVVASVPAFRYQESWEKMADFAKSAMQSPLPGSRAGEIWRAPE